MKFPRTVRVFRGQWDAAPFLSVFFLLVLFLALESRLAFLPGVSIDLPEGGGPPAHPGLTVLVALDHAGQLYYDNQTISTDQLRERLAAEVRRLGAPVTLVIVADKTVTGEKFVQVAGLAKAAGIRDVLMATRPVPATRPPP
jgi:biopolymer transport protein ExbD